MNNTSIFDIIGPIMVGPSSSHTAGAVRLGLLAQKIYRETPKEIKITLYNSFAKTGKGHGTDKGLVAGLLGLHVDDPKIKYSLEQAETQGIIVNFLYQNDTDRHPNSVDIELTGENKLFVSGNSLGAGEIEVININGFKVTLTGEYHTLVLVYKDQPGMMSLVSKYIQDYNINIASLLCDRKSKGQEAAMTICLDDQIADEALEKMKQLPDMYLVRRIEAIKR